MHEQKKPQVLLLHGFTGTPHDMMPLFEDLKRRGMKVEIPLLPGHGTTADEMRRVSWEDWLSTGNAALARLDGAGPKIVIALSMGTFVATLLAADKKNRIDAVVFLSPAFALTWPGVFTTYFARLRLFHLYPFFEKRGGSDICDPQARQKSQSYRQVPVASMLEFDELRKHAISNLPNIECPVFVGFGKHDRTVNIAKAQRILSALGSHLTQTHFFPNSGHVLPVDFDQRTLCDTVSHFIETL